MIIDKRTSVFKSNDRNALSKARKDVERTCNGLGFKSLNIYTRDFSWRIFSYIYNLLQYLLCVIKIPFKSNIYIQYPAPYSKSSYYKYLIKFSKHKKCRIIYIIHDVESLRYNKDDVKNEVSMYNMADVIIVHTPAMKEALTHMGVKSQMVELTLFDYYIREGLQLNSERSNDSVAFAGNLDKSTFITELISKINDQRFLLYGKQPLKSFAQNRNVQYMGAFPPDEIDVLDAKWGLVWDGDSIDSCTGVLGNYLRYNSSHKLSLYLAAGLPVIVWDQSAIADFVSTEQIGVCVSGLKNISDILNNISKEKYSVMKSNVRSLQENLLKGAMLKSAITKVEALLS